MEYKIVASEDEPAVKQLWHYCFEKSYDPFFKWYFTNYYKNSNTLGCYRNGDLSACLQLIPYTVFLRGKAADVSYVVGVSTYPEARGTGSVGGLLRAALTEMKKRGQYASILMPSRAEFYYPHQWELCYHHYKYTIAMPALQGIAVAAGSFTPYQGTADIDKLAFVYENFVQDKHAYVVRSRLNWQQLIESFGVEEGYIYILEDAGKPAGYIFYTLQERKLLVREMAYVSQAAQQALFRFIYNHRSQADSMEWYAPYDDLTYFRLPDPKKEVILYPFMSGRIVDVQKALESLETPAGLKCRFTLKILDPLAAWNNRCFTVRVTEGKVSAGSADGQACDMECSIGAFSQLFFGRLSGKELAYMGRLSGNEPAIKLLDQIFPKCCNYINEYF